ncbi:unnamed protein product [Closterium sp. NIES-54]
MLVQPAHHVLRRLSKLCPWCLGVGWCESTMSGARRSTRRTRAPMTCFTPIILSHRRLAGVTSHLSCSRWTVCSAPRDGQCSATIPAWGDLSSTSQHLSIGSSSSTRQRAERCCWRSKRASGDPRNQRRRLDVEERIEESRIRRFDCRGSTA